MLLKVETAYILVFSWIGTGGQDVKLTTRVRLARGTPLFLPRIPPPHV